MNRCWKPDCPADPTVVLAGGDWVIRTCTKHEQVARAVTGIRQGRVPRPRDGQDALFSVAGTT